MIGEFIKIESDLNAKFGMQVNQIDYNKKVAMIPFKACVVARNNVVCNIEGKQNLKTYDMNISFSNRHYKVSFWEQSSNFGTIASIASMATNMIKERSFDNLQETMMPKIFDENGQQIGKVEYVPVKQEGMQSYNYYKLIVDNIELNCYEIGHGKKEIVFAMYDRNDVLVAMASKNMYVKNAKARYTIYTENDNWFAYSTMATIILHQIIYDNEEEVIKLGSQGHALNTFQEGLLNRYNPNFIPEIIAKENPANLPENMPLVAEKVKQSQNTFILKYRRISLAIFVIVFVLLLFFLLK